MKLIYVADPMCSWCWGFGPTLERIERHLAPGTSLRLVMGGLAKDSAEPMPVATRTMVQSAWDAVEQRTGARFNREFWERCEPRRSTWPACRAVLAARSLDPQADWRVYRALQRAYYLEARNPSDQETLVAVGVEQGLDADAFAAALNSTSVQADLERDLQLCGVLGVRGFPSLILVPDQEGDGAQGAVTITRGWCPWEAIAEPLNTMGAIRGRQGDRESPPNG